MKLRQFRRSECFVHSEDVMEYVGWIVSGGFKYSFTASNGIDKTIGFALADSILITEFKYNIQTEFGFSLIFK